MAACALAQKEREDTQLDDMNGPDRIAFMGFGEAGMAFVSGWAEERPAKISAFDLKTDASDTRAEMQARYLSYGVQGGATVREAIEGANAVFSLVTADQAVAAARAAAASIARGAFWFDCNSCAPDSKKTASEVIEGAGARYVDVAVMAPVHPKKHRVPMLVSGPHAEEAHAVLVALGMCPEIAGESIGQASSIKMLRSVMVKGLEALTAECFLAARKAGVEAQVLASLERSDPDVAWRERASYNLSRMMVHGARRAAEMREVAETVAALRLPNAMSAGSASWQDEIARHRIDPEDDDLTARLDQVLAKL